MTRWLLALVPLALACGCAGPAHGTARPDPTATPTVTNEHVGGTQRLKGNGVGDSDPPVPVR